MSLLSRIRSEFLNLQKPNPLELKKAIENLNVKREELTPYLEDPEFKPYGRKLLFSNDDVEILVMNWANKNVCAPHDHGNSFGYVFVIEGDSTHTLYTLDQNDIPQEYLTRVERKNTKFFAPKHMIHSMENKSDSSLITLHIYSPPITNMKVYDLEKCAVCVVSDDCGAWWPDEQRQLLEEIKLNNSTFAKPN